MDSSTLQQSEGSKDQHSPTQDSKMTEKSNGDDVNGSSSKTGESDNCENKSSSNPSTSTNPTQSTANVPIVAQNTGDGNQGGIYGQENDEHSFEKRPRLRLAHACDRCRKRKIRCDTEQPCGPCKLASSDCTFHAPPRRVTKPKPPPGASSSSAGTKRPHSPSKQSWINGTGNGNGNGDGQGGENGEKSAHQSNLEARLAALEAMLGDVPPKVHNAYLSSLDASLNTLNPGNVGSNGFGAAFANVNGVNGGTGVDNEWLARSITQNGGGNGMGLTPEMILKGKFKTGSVQDLHRLKGLRRKEEGEDDADSIARRMEGMSFFYEDEIGQAKWQGSTSGFPLLDLLTAATAADIEQQAPGNTSAISTSPSAETSFLTNLSPSTEDSPTESIMDRKPSISSTQSAPKIGERHMSSDSTTYPSSRLRGKSRFFPDRTPRPHQTLDPEASWKVITGVIPSDLMDTLVRCYLSTSHLLWPFLHVPSFLADYANPQQWGEPGFACFIVAICTLSSRHVDDPRVRANPQDPSTAGKTYFELFKRLRDLPSADRPTLYSIQAAFLAAIYAFGLGNLSKAFALQAESITLCLDGGLHRSVDGYDHFDAIEKETRKRTFWSIYSWDKQSAALFGRPPIINLRVADTPEPLVVDDENLSAEGIKDTDTTSNSRIGAFVAAIRLHVILEGVLDTASHASSFPTSPFLSRAAAHLAKRYPQCETLEEEEALLNEWKRILPKYWQYDAETANSRDPIRITQAERLHCLEHLVKMLIYRHRFSGFVSTPASTSEEKAKHLELCRTAMQCALTIIADHVHISQRGMMTYYGVHVIHQLAQAGRTLVAVVLNCRNTDFRPLIAPSIEGLKSCVGLLRRFSGRYLCGLRSADIIDEFCRICNIPVDSPRVPDGTGRAPPAWLRPVRKRVSTSAPPPDRTKIAEDSKSVNLDIPTTASVPVDEENTTDTTGINQPIPSGTTDNDFSTGIPDLDALFNTSEYFDMSMLSPPRQTTTINPDSDPIPSLNFNANTTTNNNNTNNNQSQTFTNNGSTSNGQEMAWSNGPSAANMASIPLNPAEVFNDTYTEWDGSGPSLFNEKGEIKFDYPPMPMGTGNNQDFSGGYGGFGGEMLAGEGMDSVSDGLKGGQDQGLSAATILSLLEEGSFDYGKVFTDQAPLPMNVDQE